MSGTTKKASNLSAENVLRSAHVQETGTISINGFVSAKVGHRITLALTTTSVANDTELYTYFDLTTQIMQLRVVYTDGSRGTLLSVERTA